MRIHLQSKSTPGTFGVVGSYSGGQNPTNILLGDFNKDNKPDLVAGTAYSGVKVYLNQADGSGKMGSIHTVYGGRGRSVIGVGDFNEDTYLDIATSNGTTVEILLNSGNGSTFYDNGGFSVGGAPRYITAGDLDYDGHLDIAATVGDQVSVILGNGNGTFGSVTGYATGSLPNGIRFKDMDNDLRQDIVVGNNGASTVSILRNTCK